MGNADDDCSIENVRRSFAIRRKLRRIFAANQTNSTRSFRQPALIYPNKFSPKSALKHAKIAIFIAKLTFFCQFKASVLQLVLEVQMLYKLEIENFYSIRDRQVIDLSVAKSVPDEPGRFESIGIGLEDRVPKVIGFFGANAAGKSNVLKAISFLSWFISGGFNHPPGSYLPFNRFLNNDFFSKPARLAIWFTGSSDPQLLGQEQNQSSRYCYEVSLGGPANLPQVVLSESLKYWDYQTNRPILLFERDAEGSVKATKAFGLAGFKAPLEKILRPSVSVISTLAQLKHSPSEALWHFAQRLSSNILMKKASNDGSSIAKFYAGNPNLMMSLNQEIERIDLGVSKFELLPLQNMIMPALQHRGLSNPVAFDFESHGTVHFLEVFPLIARALEVGGIAVIDELDLSVHPIILPEILGWFYDPERNPHGAQLWFTGQNASLLEHLIKEEIFFCQKDKHGVTEVYGLSNIERVRRTDNFYRKYLDGVYGAVPLIG
jgi:hypothetical protein